MSVPNGQNGHSVLPTNHHFATVCGASRRRCARLPGHLRVGLRLLSARALGADSRSQKAACQERLGEHCVFEMLLVFGGELFSCLFQKDTQGHCLIYSTDFATFSS